MILYSHTFHYIHTLTQLWNLDAHLLDIFVFNWMKDSITYTYTHQTTRLLLVPSMCCCLQNIPWYVCGCPGCWVRWKHLGTNFISTKSLLSWADQLIEILTKGASRRKKGLSSIFTHFHFYSGFRKYTFFAEAAARLQQPAATTHVCVSSRLSQIVLSVYFFIILGTCNIIFLRGEAKKP